MKKKHLLLIFLNIICANLFAQTWNGNTSTDWNTASNWTPAGVPNSTSAVTINNTANKPKLANNIILASLDMTAGSTLDFNSFTLTVNGAFNMIGATLNNSDGSSDITITVANSDLSYFGSNIINDNITINHNGSGYFLEAYSSGTGGSDTFNGNVAINFNAGGMGIIGHSRPSSFYGDVTITRTVEGITKIFNRGLGALTGNFTYTNNAGGETSINQDGILCAPIGGMVNITVTGSGNPDFQMNRIKNLTTGGTISVQNSGQFTINYDTLQVSELNVNGFTGSYLSSLNRNSIKGNVSISDLAGGLYIGGNNITGNSIFTANSGGTWHEGNAVADTFNGNTTFNITGTAIFIICYDQPSAFNGDLTINRSGPGPTYILYYSGLGALTGNFSYTNHSGGPTYINSRNMSSAPIGGTVNISATGMGNPIFTMNMIKNLTSGGTISVQNSGQVTIDDDTLKVSALNVNGFTGVYGDEFMRNSITGNVSLSDDATNTNWVHFGKNIITGNTVFTSNAPIAWFDSYQGSNIYDGNFRYNRVAGTINLAYNDTTSFNGDLILNAAEGIVFSNVFRFGGTAKGTVEELGTQPIIIPKIFMDKTGEGGITLNDTVTVSNNLNLNSGVIKTGSNNNLVIPDGVTYTGGSDASYVDGPMLKIGNDAFTFPLGQKNAYAPITITAPVAVTDQFRAQYKNEEPGLAYDSTQKDAILNHISRAEYWLLDRTAGTSDVSVTIGWANNRSGVVNDIPSLRVTRWDGSKWKDLGHGTTTGTNAMGTIQTAAAVTSFSPFTLASTTAQNPLPINISRFSALRQSSSVFLNWSTENEVNFSHFEVERSGRDNNFSSIGEVTAHNIASLQSYSLEDQKPLKGTNLYRLKLIDRDGKVMYSKVVSVIFNERSVITIYPNPARDYILVDGVKEGMAIEINDASGKLVKRFISNASNKYQVSDLHKGMYFVKIHDKENSTVTKLIIE